MDWNHLFLSFEGRINRAKYWIGGLLLLAAVVVVSLVGTALLAGIQTTASSHIQILVTVVFILTLYPSLAIATKRLHDRGKSAWWLLLFYGVPAVLDGVGTALGEGGGTTLLTLISVAIAIWALVELGFLKGTQGPNDYGPDPLGARQADASF